jgi:hypothetical protein
LAIVAPLVIILLPLAFSGLLLLLVHFVGRIANPFYGETSRRFESLRDVPANRGNISTPASSIS